MKEELIAMAKLLTKMASRNQREVISQYVHSLKANQLNTSRMIADEVMDYFLEEDVVGKKAKLATEIYDKTMEYYELNTT